MAGKKSSSPQAGLESVRASAPVAAPDMAGAEDAAPDPSRAPLLPQPCPVTPLGVQGTKIYFLDQLKQLQAVPTECRKNDMKLWFGDGWLVGHFEEVNKDGFSNGKFNQDKASTALIEDCRIKGIFNPEGRVFGRGAHRARDNEQQLVLHMGSQVMMAGKGLLDRKGKPTKGPLVHSAGAIGDSYFPALGSLPAPADKPSTEQDGQDLLELLRSWYWVDNNASPLLLLGFIGQMFICGALGWRTHMWLAGPTASGKTFLQKIIRSIHRHWALHTEDATEAALRQVLKDDTLPVLIDEAEAHDNPERLRALVNLMKKASSGAKMHRGSADHKHSEFTAQSCFLLSSVLHASMRGEDRNRIAILEMRAVPEGAPRPDVDLLEWRELGRRMHRRMIEHWPRFDQTLEAYQAAIARHRFEGRWGDTYGTLLACADLLLYDYGVNDIIPDLDVPSPTDRINAAVTAILPLMARGKVEARSDVERVQQHMLTHMLPGAHGMAAESVGYWLSRAMALRAAEFETMDGEIDHEARNKLKSHGLRVVAITEKPGGALGIDDARPEDWRGSFIAVAYATNKALSQIFERTEWADGGWIQSLGKIEGAIKGRKVRFGGPKPDNVILVPLAALQGDEG